MDLFNSGPHRFWLRPAGRVFLPPLRFDLFTDVTVVYDAPLEVAVGQSGRLIAPDEGALWSLVDAITTEARAARKGTLIDHSGRVYADMTLLLFTPAERVDRGRVASVGYEARYVRLAN
jgi:hypothetical protein